MKNRNLIFLFTIIVAFGITLAGCDSQLTGSTDVPESIQPDRGLTAAPGNKSGGAGETFGFYVFEIECFLDDDLECDKADGELIFRRNTANNTFSWRLKTSAFDAGHSHTIWIGNFDGIGFGNDGGWGAGGVVGGNGQFTASGNHCVWALNEDDQNGFTGGFRPGTPPDCDMVDVTETIWFFVLDHGDWEPGDMLSRWDPTNGTGNPLVLESTLFTVIP